MNRYTVIALVALLLGVGKGSGADDAGDPSPIQSAIDALRQEPANTARLETLAQATVASGATPEQARALAICYLAYRLADNVNFARNAKALLDANHATSVYRDHIRDDRLFNQTICPDCSGKGTLETPCSQCSGGKCTNCNGRGENPGLSGMINCSTCRRTGRCRSCNGVGFFSNTCRNCRGAGNFVVFKAQETKEIYLSLLQNPFGSASVAVANAPIVLEEATIQQFNADYKAATSLHKHSVYQAFLRQIGSEEATPSPILINVPDGMQFVVTDVRIGKGPGNEVHYHARLTAKGHRSLRLMIPDRDKAFAASLAKGTTLTSSGWLKLLEGLPQRGTSDKLYRSVNDYLTLR